MAPSGSSPLYLDTSRGPVFALAHGAGPGVLLVPPFGWDDVASYRARRAWAAQLAGAGHLALRIDLPGSGDSAGSPRDPDRLAAWTAAVRASAEWLHAESGRVAIAGIGLGGLLAVRAAAEGAPVDDLVLWATPGRGRHLVRELQAFAAMEDADLAEARALDPVEEGAIEAGGFLLSAETAAALREVDLVELTLPGGRALLLDRDGLAPDAKLAAHLDAQGYAVTLAPGPGYAAMFAVPHEAEPAWDAFATISTWLAASPGPGSVPDGHGTRPTAEVGGVRESVVTVAQPFGRLFGVLSEPAEGASGPVCAVLLNAGAIRRSGPNRMWTEAARRWAAGGVATLRLDVEGIGDADGDDARDADVTLYVPRYVEQVRAALDALEARGHRAFLLAGLCSGSFWALHTALEDPRVRAAVLLNPRLLVWDDALVELREARRVIGEAQGRAWRRLVRGTWGPRKVARLSVDLAKALALRARARGTAGSVDLAPIVGRIAASDARFVLAFSGDEPLHEELALDGVLAQLEALSNVELADLPGRDHTLRPLAAQRAAHAVLDRALAAT